MEFFSCAAGAAIHVSRPSRREARGSQRESGWLFDDRRQHSRAVRVKLQVPPLRCPGFPLSLVALAAPRVGNPGPLQLGMTKLGAVAHLGMGGDGWTESKKLIWTEIDSQPLGGTQR